MAEKRGLPHWSAPIVDENGLVTIPWRRFFELLTQKAATQSDASADPTPKADFDALIDKLQAAGLME